MMYFISTRLSMDPRSEEGKARYENLLNALTSLGPWSDRLDNTWLVESKLSASRIRTLLKPHLLEGDRVFVGQFTENWAGYNMGSSFPEWAKRRDFSTPGQAP
ncbi:MAG: hypothetical protein KC656_07095 [Myxococcales bacterium]|nr:hypothetical protein [Myxococcales bacterium]MCB9671337.1 hypothetical protein [Alphaproteobacteria bacterium]MCB9694725.1 hypothetical protein [Alphaproteobacteria bacterium]